MTIIRVRKRVRSLSALAASVVVPIPCQTLFAIAINRVEMRIGGFNRSSSSIRVLELVGLTASALSGIAVLWYYFGRQQVVVLAIYFVVTFAVLTILSIMLGGYFYGIHP
jgi:hypothetical protein